MIGAMVLETLCRWLAATALPWAVLTVALCRPGTTAAPARSSVWLPLTVGPDVTATATQTLPEPSATATASPSPALTPTPRETISPAEVHQGNATWYNATGGGACSFDPTPDDLMVAALNATYYGQADLSGAYVEVTGPKGMVVVRIVDLCPGCLEVGLDLDLSQQAFEAIAELSRGRVPVIWRVVSPDLSGPLAYRFADGSSQWWTGIQVRNHRNPVRSLEYRDGNDAWVMVPRKTWNYFVQSSPGMGPGPYELRVTDVYGNQITDSDVPLTPGGTVPGSAQFPAAPGH